jgi:hypothetical protein
MKFQIAIVLLAIGLACGQSPVDESAAAPALAMDIPLDGFNSSQCIYNVEDKVLSCKGAVEAIECPAVCDTAILGEKARSRFNIYGIGMVAERVEGKMESVRYWLHPRKLDNSSYLNHTVVADNGKQVDLVVGCGERFVDVAGLRISDCKCYERLVRQFDEAARQPRMVRVETEPTVVQEIPLIGEILVLDKHVQKRWLWGYGWGGLGGWGWGGWPLYGGWGWGK